MFKFNNNGGKIASVRKRSKVTAGCFDSIGGGGSGGMGGLTGNGGRGIQGGINGKGHTRFNPVYDRLEEPSIVDEWLSRDIRFLNKMFRYLYLRDEICGPVIDMYGSIPWSSWHLSGIKDKSVMRIYEESMNNFNPEKTCAHASKEFLTVGRNCISSIFDSSSGVFKYFIPQDPDMLEITPIPVMGFDPKIDLIPPRNFKYFLNSKDPRDIRARDELSADVVMQMFSGGRIPLEPLNTLFSPRCTFPSDWVGTSLLTRILPFWALQKSLLDSTLISSRRRTNSILHVEAGIQDIWEPQDYELDELVQLIMSADEDPEGAIVVTRNGVKFNEVKDPKGLWKISDEWEYLSNGKMRALGVNEDLLSGGLSLSNMEVAVSMFMEGVRNLRSEITNQMFHYKMFPVLAQAHDFRPRTQAELSHKIRVRNGGDDSQYLIPKVEWHKDLRPKADMEYVSLLKELRDVGLPIPLSAFAAAGDYSLDRILDDSEKEMDYMKRLKKYKDELGEIMGVPEEGEVEGMGAGGAEAPIMAQLLAKNPDLINTIELMDADKGSVFRACNNIITSGKVYEYANDSKSLNNHLNSTFETDNNTKNAVRLTLASLGISKKLDNNEIKIISEKISPKTDNIEKLQASMCLLNTCTKKEGIKNIDAKNLAEKTVSMVKKEQLSDKNVLSGVGREKTKIV